MCMCVQALPVTSVDARTLGLPIGKHNFVITAMRRIGHMPGDGAVCLFGSLPAARVTGSQIVFAECIDAKALSVADLAGEG